MPQPDIAGFREAMANKRERFAEPVTFLHRADVTWPAGTPIDPETERPYDPTIKPVASAAVPYVAPFEVSFGGSSSDDTDAEMTPIGWAETGRVLLIGDEAAASASEGAERFELRGEDYKVMSQRPDGIVGTDRHLVWGRKE